ncbi:MAG TPA: excinuclease ABC subunit A [Alphaproteobacteria bacterium]|nr:excinuclease ABC subunit A [Alphaproteobacteria bacterium]
MTQKMISVRGAREHNLKDVSIDIPRDKLIVFTGLSGSGKSSLAFDTIYAEGQRRYVESLSAYARQFLEMMQKPDIDHIEGLSPAIAIEQKTTSKNPRSTVGTVTEIYDYMRLLWARAGIPISPATGEPISSQTISQMVDQVMEMKEGTKLLLKAPLIRGRKGEFRKELAELQARGFQRVKIDGETYNIEETPKLDKNVKHDLDVIVDRIVVREDVQTRLSDSFETALRLADGLAVVDMVDAKEGEPNRKVFSERFACPVSGFTIEEIEPRLFSFNNPHGACTTCDGLGSELAFDEVLIIPDDNLSLKDGAIAPWAKTTSPFYMQTLNALAAEYKFSLIEPWHSLAAEAQNLLLHGSGDREITFTYDDGLRRYSVSKTFEGVIPNLERRYRETDSNWVREELDQFKTDAACSTCGGFRLKQEALCVKMAGFNIGEVCQMPIREVDQWFRGLPAKISEKQNAIAERILKEICDRLGFLMNVGLEYLTLARASGTLSGGESQRIRLASQIGSGLTGVLYVLDEPSIGLHQRDNAKLLETLKGLRDLGNTVLVVEHDEDAIRQADFVVDIGPRAGIHGGHVIVAGTPDEVMAHEDSITGDYLSGKKFISVPQERRKINPRRMIKVEGASGNNLQDVSAELPIGVFTSITGVSGGGKSTFTIETLYKSAARRLNGARSHPAPHKSIKGLEYLDKCIDIDQSPIGRTPRSNPATYTGAFSPIRDWFAGLPEAQARGYKAGRFSFNVKGGRCEACQGDGVIKIEMHFLPDVYVQCEVCRGRRYNRETLEITYKNQSIADVLAMTVDDAAEFFKAVPAIYDKLYTLQRVGLGYIKVGQQATTLSGGEAQRIKLAKELSRKATGRTLYILDEPTTGLHFEDVKKLLEVLHELVEQGNTVVVIEHNLEVVKTSDWVVDFGPEGGTLGGQVVGFGRPEDIAAIEGSHTGFYLAQLLDRGQA